MSHGYEDALLQWRYAVKTASLPQFLMIRRKVLIHQTAASSGGLSRPEGARVLLG